jgi:hypothetical protein
MPPSAIYGLTRLLLVARRKCELQRRRLNLAEAGTTVRGQIEYPNLKETCRENGWDYPPLRKCRSEGCLALTRNLGGFCADCITARLRAKHRASVRDSDQLPAESGS